MKKILSLPQIYENWLNLQGRTNLVLGLTYFELGDFDETIKYLEKVSSSDENYPRALLGLGWSFLKLQQYQKMIPPLETFIAKFPNSEYLPEVYLLLGQSHLKIRLYDKSIYYFSKILSMFPNAVKNQELSTEIEKNIGDLEQQLEQQKLDLIMLESKLMDTIILPDERWIPQFMKNEIVKLEDQQKTILIQTKEEIDQLANMEESLANLKLMVRVRTKDWRNFAEYGISRALFLKEQEQE